MQNYVLLIFLWTFSCEIAHYEKSLVSVFQEFFDRINKIVILTGILGTRLLFYKIWTLSWYFLISLVLSRSATCWTTRIYRVYKQKLRNVSLVVKIKFDKTSKNLKILWRRFSAKFSFTFCIFINSSSSFKKSCLG